MTALAPQQIGEGNRLIAEFVGYKKHTEYKNDWFIINKFRYDRTNNDKAFMWPVDKLKFHSSFDWQIPVWSKVVKDMEQTRLKKGVFNSVNEYAGFCGSLEDLKNSYHAAIDTEHHALGFLTLVKAIQLIQGK